MQTKGAIQKACRSWSICGICAPCRSIPLQTVQRHGLSCRQRIRRSKVSTIYVARQTEHQETALLTATTKRWRTLLCPRHRIARGFTYVGTLILLVILAIVSGATISLGMVAHRRVAEEELLSIGLQFRSAFQSYYMSTPAGQPRYPRSLNDLVRDPRYPLPVRHLRQLYLDPMTERSDWELVFAPEGGIMGVHSSASWQPIKIDQFAPPFEYLKDSRTYRDWIFFFSPSRAPPGLSSR